MVGVVGVEEVVDDGSGLHRYVRFKDMSKCGSRTFLSFLFARKASKNKQKKCQILTSNNVILVLGSSSAGSLPLGLAEIKGSCFRTLKSRNS